MAAPLDMRVSTLGECRIPSPRLGESSRRFVSDESRVRLEDELGPGASAPVEVSMEKAGPRERIFFEPARTTAAIVTCGGLSPGLNNVIRSAYYELAHNYGVARVLGIRSGYRGLDPQGGEPPVEIDEPFVHDAHHLGGTVLGSSRGALEPPRMADFLEGHGIDLLLCVGGDGTQRGAHALARELARRGQPRAVIGIPKTIDNDIPYVWMSFGYATAVEVAQEVVDCAHVEALGAPNGIGVVKVMGRAAGFIAAGAALASQAADFVLVPEVPFPLEGERGLLAALERRLLTRGHAVLVVAEGAGQHLFAEGTGERDASGNPRFQDIGPLLCERIRARLDAGGIEHSLKYIDPSYAIRSVPANAWDRILSDRMARMAVHAAMAGKTDVLVGHHHNSFVHVPIGIAVASPRRMDPASDLWNAVVASTQQPRW